MNKPKAYMNESGSIHATDLSSRVWLNESEDMTAFMASSASCSIYNPKKNGSDPSGECQIKIADCSRIVHLDFCWYDDADLDEAVRKIEVMENELAKVKSYLRESKAVVEKFYNKKYPNGIEE
jgi:hypothetical protein